MSLTYEESAALMNEPVFRGRIKVAALTFAVYILNEPSGTESHNSRYHWAQQTFQQPDMTAAQLQPGVVMDPAVQGSGAAIDDGALQVAVEGVIKKLL